MVRVWTDGACLGNPGPGGWGWVDERGERDSGGERSTTNQRMELQAARQAVAAHPGPVEVVSDSKYVVSAFNEGWIDGWLRRGWKNSRKEPVANQDLWKPFVDEVAAHGQVTFSWVKGHAGDPMNEEADRLATEAAATLAAGGSNSAGGANSANSAGGSAPAAVATIIAVSESGGGSSADGAGSDPASVDASTAVTTDEAPTGRSADRRAPDGYRYAVSGIRRLDARSLTAARSQLAKILPAQGEFHPDLVVLSGLRPGPEAIGAQVALDAGIAVVAVLPWPDPQATLRSADRSAFAELLGRVADTVVLESKAPSDADGRSQALARRDGWLAKVADGALLVRRGDTTEGRALLRRFGRLGDEVWDLDLSALP